MNKKLIKKMTILGIGLMTITAGRLCYARNMANYSAKVPIINDYETPDLSKVNETDAINNCTSMGTGGLKSWVEDKDGNNITAKISYSTTGLRAMAYCEAQKYVGQNLHLNISTDISTWHDVDTIGKWSPDAR